MSASRFPTKQRIIEEHLRREILNGDIVPGERLQQADLAARMGASPTPVREALRSLEAEGLITYSPHRGVTVTELSLDELGEVFKMRSVLESLATVSAVGNLAPATLIRLEDTQAKIEHAVQDGWIPIIRRLNLDLHRAIYAAAEMPRLFRAIENLMILCPWNQIHAIPGGPEKAVAEHRRLIRAIQMRDSARAGELIAEHITLSWKRLQESEETSVKEKAEAAVS